MKESKYFCVKINKNFFHWNFLGIKRRFSSKMMELYSNKIIETVKLIDSKIVDNGFEISIIVCNKEYIKNYKKQYFGIEQITDVISISLLEGDFIEYNSGLLGDIYICNDVIKENSKKYKNSFVNEFIYILIHGILHIFSYDDCDEEKKEKMFKFQNDIFDVVKRKR